MASASHLTHEASRYTQQTPAALPSWRSASHDAVLETMYDWESWMGHVQRDTLQVQPVGSLACLGAVFRRTLEGLRSVCRMPSLCK